MRSTIRVADSKGRVVLPGFANATLVIETISENEIRVRKARVIPEDQLHFSELDIPFQLSERDARNLVRTLKTPPKPVAAARRAARKFKKNYGQMGH